jgi:putative MATE family efflux protein
VASATGAADGREPLLKAIAAFGVPLVVAMAFGAIFNLADLLIVARFGDPEVSVAAVTIPSIVSSIPQIIFNGIVNAMIALVARTHAMGSHRRASFAAGQGVLLTIVAGVVFGVPPAIWADEINRALGAEGAVLPPANDYLAITSAGTIGMFLLLTVTGVMRAAGNSVVPVMLLLGANVLNVLLNLWWIFGGAGVPAMGVAGAAWATVVSRIVFAAIGMGFLWRGFLGIRVRRFAWHGKTLWALLVIGVPSCLQWLVRMTSYLYVLRFVAKAAPLAAGLTGAALVGEEATRHVTEAQAAFGVGLRLDTLALFAGFGWGAAAATFVGQSLGRGQPERAVRASWIALGLNLAMMVGFAAVYVLFPDALLRLMGFGVSTDPATLELGRTYLYVSSAGYVYLAVATVVSQALAGAGATKFPLLIEVVFYGAIGYPLTAWAAGQADTYGLRGLWLVGVILHFTVAVAYVVWFRTGRWLRKELS